MKLLKNSSFILFAFFFPLYFVLSYFLAYRLQIYHNDAVARTALGFFTAFGRDPHLGAVGFVWQPLPSLLQVPLLKILRPLDLQMLSGPFITSILGAITVVFINKISKLLGRKHRSLSLLAVLMYGLNPMIVLYAAIGSSETILIASLVLSTYFFVKSFIKSTLSDLILSSIFIVMAFGSRYESVIAFLSVSLLIIIFGALQRKSIASIESKLHMYALPFIYIVFLWIILNWVIMGNPFYFLNSEYSNSSFTESIKLNPSLMENSYHSLSGSLSYALKRILFLAPGLLFIPTAVHQFLKKKNGMRNLAILASLLVPYFAILTFHVYQLYKGDSLGWLRFFMYSIVAVTLMSLFFIKKQAYLRYSVVLLLGLGMCLSVLLMANPQFGKEENSFIRKIENNEVTLDYSRTYLDQKNVALFMDQQTGNILIDTNEAFAMPLFAKDPTRYVITSDIDYLKIVKDFKRYVSWIIVPSPSPDVMKKNIIYRYYPNIAEGKADGVVKFTEIDGWLIFKVNN